MFNVMVANVAEAGDIVLLGIVLAVTLVVGTALLALDTVVGRLQGRRESKAHDAPRSQESARGSGEASG